MLYGLQQLLCLTQLCGEIGSGFLIGCFSGEGVIVGVDPKGGGTLLPGADDKGSVLLRDIQVGENVGNLSFRGKNGSRLWVQTSDDLTGPVDFIRRNG